MNSPMLVGNRTRLVDATEEIKKLYPLELGQRLQPLRIGHVGGGLRCDCDDCADKRRRARNKRKAERRRLRGK